jgi:hypothetical protein
LHKLVISQQRSAAFAAKARKDIVQAIEVLDVLITDRPGDLPLAIQSFEDHGERHRKVLAKALAALKRERPDLAKKVKGSE